MRACPQDPEYHQEGDVWTHTQLVLTELVAIDAWRTLGPEQREIVFASALLHDIGKPECTRVEAGHVTSRRARRGEVLSRRILWELGMPLHVREHVAQLVRFHGLPMTYFRDANGERRAISVSQSVSCHLLSILAEADARGRRGPERSRCIDDVSLFREVCEELGCPSQAYPFASDSSRFQYFRKPGRNPRYHAPDCQHPVLVLLCGLPGVGKDAWVSANAQGRPEVSLDALREELDVAPTQKQGTVVFEARERAREFLRKGTSFVFMLPERWALPGRPLATAKRPAAKCVRANPRGQDRGRPAPRL